MTSIVKACSIDTLSFLSQIEGNSIAEYINTIKDNKDGTFTFTFKYDTSIDIEPVLDNFINNYDSFISTIQPAVYGYDLKLKNLIQPEMAEFPFNIIDFKRHLKSPCVLQKTVFMNDDGRPLKSIYKYKGEIMAEIIYIFRGIPLMTRRTEILYYKLLDNSNAPPIVIKDKIFNMLNSRDRYLVVSEREKCRMHIIDDVNGFLIGVIKQISGKNESEITEMIIPFFNEVELLEKEYIRLGTNSYIDFISNIDLSSTSYTWLSYEISPGLKIRNYMVSKLSYIAKETYTDFVFNTIETI